MLCGASELGSNFQQNKCKLSGVPEQKNQINSARPLWCTTVSEVLKQLRNKHLCTVPTGLISLLLQNRKDCIHRANPFESLPVEFFMYTDQKQCDKISNLSLTVA